MKKTIPTLLLLATCASLFAQKTIDLGKSDMAPGKRAFNITEIIDARRDQTSIGMCRAGVGNNKEKITLDRPMPEAVYAYVQQKMPDQPGLPSVALRVTRFAVYEDVVGSKEVAIAALDMEAFLKKDGGYQKLNDLKIRRLEPGLDVTKFHNDNIRNALQATVEQLRDSIDWKNLDKKPAGILRSMAEIRTIFYPKIMKDTVFQPGFYRNVSEFRANAPSAKIKLVQENDKMLILIERDRKPGKFRKLKRQDKAWGACDGEHFFFLKNWVFFEMTRQPDGNFRFEGYDVEKVRSNSTIGWVAFGVVGAAVASEATRRNSTGLKELDLETGGFWPVK